MPMYTKRKVLLVKSESPNGTDATPTGAANAIVCRNLKISPLIAEGEDRDLDVNYVGEKGFIIAGKTLKISFDVEMAGAGAAGTAPGYGPLFKACAMSETINGGVSVVYAPVAPGSETSCTIYFYMGGRRHRAVYCLGNVKPSLSKGKIGLFSFDMTGIYVGPDDQALPTPTYTLFQKPLAVTIANTTPFTLDGFAGKFSELTLDTGNVYPYRNLVGSESMRFVDRSSQGSVKLEDELVGTKDWWTKMAAGTPVALSAQHGTVAGNIVVLAAPSAQIDPRNPSMEDDDNISMLGMSLLLMPSAAGNDEYSITVK